MIAKELDDIRDRIEQEGFDYAMVHYSDWEEIKDKKFHSKLEKFLKTRLDLIRYLNLDENEL